MTGRGRSAKSATSASVERDRQQRVDSANSISETAAVRSAFCGWGHESLSARFVDFFTAVATTSNVCYALTTVIPEVSFFGHE
jgi:hypothetical protein